MAIVKNTSNRIAHNTLFLYIRMFLIMIVNLITVRVVLSALGETDYGIYNVVAGFVSMFSFLTASLVAASQRFFAYELGRGDFQKLKLYFGTSVICYLFVAVILLIVFESFGVWFLNHKMVIPASRMEAANWLFQISILSFFFTMIVIPYNSIIIARERMGVYAIVSIVDTILKLGIVYLLVLSSYDKLIFYAILTCIVTFITSTIYIVYCTKMFKECHRIVCGNLAMFKELGSYSSWNLFGTLAAAIRSQGINILLNIFFGPVVNAARGIAFQVNSALNQFVYNFFKAVQPQITKRYAIGEYDSMMNLVFKSSLMCFYLIFILSLPVLLETNFLLTIWLKEVPNETVLFCRLVIITTIIESISYSLMTAIQATGRIKLYQSITGGLLLLNLPISFLFLKAGYPPESTMYIAISLAVVAQISRVWLMKKQLSMSIMLYLKRVVLVLILALITASIVPLFLAAILQPGFNRFLCVSAISVISCVISIYYIGITQGDRVIIKQYIVRLLPKK